jgi:molecular chaperone HscC
MIIGIDLGTTNSLVALWRDGAAELVPNALGEVLTPSAVSVDDSGTVLVGAAARDRLLTHPDRTAATFKRAMGTDHMFTLGKKCFRAEDLSALVLMSLRADAERALGEPVTEAVITVPAYFGEAQRQATKAAGQIAGLRVERLLNEPTAAALAYGLADRTAQARTMVLDLGGGTFDVSILEMFEGVMEVRASAGDVFLGGEDFCAALAEGFIAAVGRAAGIPPLGKPHPSHTALRRAAELAKRALTDADSTEMVMVHAGATLTWTVTRDDLEQHAEPLLRRLRAPIERALRDAKLDPDSIDNLVLAGGATRMPAFRRLMARLFQRIPVTPINPDEVVARGAAVQAGLKMRDAALDDVVMTDVAPFTLGVETAATRDGRIVATGLFSPIIERNTVIPASRSMTLGTLRKNQREIEVKVYQGEARMVADNALLGDLSLDMPPGEAGEQKVEVRLTYDPSGLLEVDATILSTGETYHRLIENRPGSLSPAELVRRLEALSALKVHPRDQAENQAMLARLGRLFTERLGEERDHVARLIDDFNLALARQDPAEIAALRESLTKHLAQIDRSFFT